MCPKAAPPRAQRSFNDYHAERDGWVTVLESEFYPDILDKAAVIYDGVIERFEAIAAESKDSADLLRRISKESNEEPARLRTRLLQVFRRYVSQTTDHERLKKIGLLESTINTFGHAFRDLKLVRQNLKTRSKPDEALMAILYEYSTRGTKGYDLTEAFFTWFEARYKGQFTIEGKRRGGRDPFLSDLLEGFPKRIPIDFLIRRTSDGTPVVVGFARYDSTRGGAQADDRTGSNSDKANEILRFSDAEILNLKVLFISDGPGLTHKDIWEESASLEQVGGGRVMVCTLKMLDQRLTAEWIDDP